MGFFFGGVWILIRCFLGSWQKLHSAVSHERWKSPEFFNIILFSAEKICLIGIIMYVHREKGMWSAENPP